MTITNHIKFIQEHCSVVIAHVDARDYQDAHLQLDYIHSHILAAHRHIDNLQRINNPFLAPEPEESS